MAAPIVLTPSPSPETLPVSSIDWRFDPPKFTFFWLMSTPAPDDFISKVKFPNYAAIPDFEDFTSWQFEVAMDHQSYYIFPSPSSPFCKIEGALTYEGDLGVLTGNHYEKTLNFSFFNLSILSEGQYFATAKCKITAINPVTSLREEISSRDLIIEFKPFPFFVGSPLFELIFEGMQYYFDEDFNLQIAPMVFNYHQGGSLPEAQSLYKFHIADYVPALHSTSDPALVTTLVAVHDNFSKHLISFTSAIEVFALGTYNFNFVIGFLGFGVFPDNLVTINVVLNVLEEVSADFLVSPDAISFEATVGESIPLSQSLSISSVNSWEVISPLPTWLSLSQYSGSGNATVLVSLSTYNNLPAGVHSFDIIFSDGITTLSVTVQLTLQVFLVHPFVSGNLNFTKNLDYLNFSTEFSNTYVLLTLNITIYSIDTYSETNYIRTYNVPLPNKKGEFHIGTIVEQLLEEIESLNQVVPSRNSNYAITSYKPAKVNVTYEEKQYIEYPIIGDPFAFGEINNLLFIKGNKPFVTSSQLCILSAQQQNISRVTADSAISISFVHLGIPLIIVKRNNIVIEELQLLSFDSDGAKIIYNFFRCLNTFSPGDLIEIYIANGTESRVHRFLVHHSGLESTFFWFENDNGVMQPFEFTGRIRPTSGYKHTTASKYSNLFNKNEKVNAENMQSFMINVGPIQLTDNLILDAIIKSKKVWCSFNGLDGDYIRVDCTTGKLPLFDTLKPELTFDLEFNILENSDAVLYPKY